MRDGKVSVTKFNDVLITTGRYAPFQTTVIVKAINQTIQPLSILKQKQSDLIGTIPTVPNVAPDVPYY